MKRIDTATKAVDLFGPGKHGFKAGNVLAGEAPTKLSAEWFNATQEEVARAIEAFGLELDPEDNGQLAGALTAFFAQVALLAPLDSPELTGVPTAPTAEPGTNTDQVATMAALKQAIEDLVGSAPGALDTLVELAAALGNDADFATTVTNALAGKLAKAGDEMSGALVIALAALQLTLRNSNNTAAAVVDHQRFLRGSGSGVRAAWQSIRGASNALGDLYLTFLSAADAVLHRYTFGADGKLLLPDHPTDDLGAATKLYVDQAAKRSITFGPYPTTSGGTFNGPHDLPWIPKEAVTNLICKVNNNGFTAGLRLPLHKYFTVTSVEYGPEVWWDSVNFGYLFGWGGFVIWDRSGSGNFVTGNPAQWDFEIILKE
ncbi:MAG: hypothetical protein KF895_02740 [Parvibaculum sp.]|nr:hypothetical protein [Parvibaculum sp.]